MPDISLIISVFNRIENLKLTLEFVARQSVKFKEILIVDDGSQQNILDCLKQCKTNFDLPLFHICQENKGFRLSRNKNNGIRFSTGDYLIFNDQDIVFTKNYFTTFAEFIKVKQFLVATPIWLNENQTISTFKQEPDFGFLSTLPTQEQMKTLLKQYNKDKLYYNLHKLGLSHKPKVRGGVFGIFKQDLCRINGFDENYKGWGNEDDDLWRRLTKAGISGRNVFNKEYPLHLYHPPARVGKERVNLDYYRDRLKDIKKGQYYCEFGLDNMLDSDPVTFTKV